jgi:hypothetical protein
MSPEIAELIDGLHADLDEQQRSMLWERFICHLLASHSSGELPKAARAASPTPVTCAEQDASGRDHSTREPVEIFEVDELATPAAGEVLIDVVAAGIGSWDELVRIGSWQIGGPAPMALGRRRPGRSQRPAPAWPSCARATR